MDLSEIREQINQIDEKMQALFSERMDLSLKVAELKEETGDRICKPEREDWIIRHHMSSVRPGLKYEYSAFIKRIMTLSREVQYKHHCCRAEDLYELTQIPEPCDSLSITFNHDEDTDRILRVSQVLSDFNIKIRSIQSESSVCKIVCRLPEHRKDIPACIFMLCEEIPGFKVMPDDN